MSLHENDAKISDLWHLDTLGILNPEEKNLKWQRNHISIGVCNVMSREDEKCQQWYKIIFLNDLVEVSQNEDWKAVIIHLRKPVH